MANGSLTRGDIFSRKAKTVKLHGSGGRQLEDGVVWQLEVFAFGKAVRDIFGERVRAGGGRRFLWA